MLIRFTLAKPSGVPIWLRPEDIRSIEKNPQDMVTTVLVMNVFLQQGPMTYHVGEGIDEAADLINSALEAQKRGETVPAPKTRSTLVSPA